MQIINLKLKNFRNYESLNLNFSNNINLIYGVNGSGKTNIVEAIYILGLTKSFRTKYDNYLLKEKTTFSMIEGEIKTSKINKYQIILDSKGKTAKINNNIQKKLSEYISKINVIIFSPDDLAIIKDSPSYRRKILNCEISQLNSKYLILLNNYNSILKQRNSYLRTMYVNKTADKIYLNLLTEKLIKEGLKINEYRKKFLEDINLFLDKYYYKISRKKGLLIKYVSDYTNCSTEKIVDKYQKSLEKDIILGKTQIGIHHDDFLFNLDKKILKEYGSEGQKKNSVIAFKLSEIEIFKNNNKEYPILILDDLFSALDNKKINNIIKLLKKKVQVFITVTDIEKINKQILENSKIYQVKNGKVEAKRL